jgi:hypothetical protein
VVQEEGDRQSGALLHERLENFLAAEIVIKMTMLAGRRAELSHAEFRTRCDSLTLRDHLGLPVPGTLAIACADHRTGSAAGTRTAERCACSATLGCSHREHR